MSKVRKISFVIGAVAVIAATAVIFMLLHDGESAQSENPDAVATATVETFTEENAEYLEEKFNSSSKEEQALALVPMMRAGEWDSNTLFPEGSVLEVDYASFEGDSEIGHTVQARAVRDGEVIEAYALYIVYDESEDAWLVGGTTKIEGE